MITQLRNALIYHIKIHSAVCFFSFVAQTYKKSHKYVQRFNDIDLYHFFVSRVLACILGDELATLATTLEVTSNIRYDVLV